MEGTLTSSSTQHALDSVVHKRRSNSLLSSQLPVCWMIVWLSADHNTATFSSTFCHIMQLFQMASSGVHRENIQVSQKLCGATFLSRLFFVHLHPVELCHSRITWVVDYKCKRSEYIAPENWQSSCFPGHWWHTSLQWLS